MNRDELVIYLKTSSETELEENLAAGSSDGMQFRFAATIAEKERRRRDFESTLKKPGFIGVSMWVFALVAAIAGVVGVWIQLHDRGSLLSPGSPSAQKSDSLKRPNLQSIQSQ